jgi:iron(III) transport system ATP-binding protein
MTVLQAALLNKKYPNTDVRAVKDFSLQMETGEIIALLGESGCGKTTVLRMIAGFEKHDSGELALNGRLVNGKGVFIAPEKRQVGLVFQDNALFPHKSVAGNIRFGLFKLSKKLVAERLNKVLKLTGLQGLEHRYPHQLSGGQQQRLALARALAPEPKLLLLDEPFSNIDSLLKEKLRKEIAHILRETGTTAIFVTHDTQDALALADKVVVMRSGDTMQQGTPFEIYQFPQSAYVAEFFGKANLISVGRNDLQLLAKLGIESQDVVGEKLLCIRPNALHITKSPGISSFEAEIISNHFLGDYHELLCEVMLGKRALKLFVHAPSDMVFENGKCYLSFKRDLVHTLPAVVEK